MVTPVTPVVADPAAPNLRCTYTHVVQSTWLGGYQAEFTVDNLGPDAAAPWQATFVLSGGGHVKTTWPGPFTQSGSSVKLSGAAWNRDLYAKWFAKTGLTVAYTGSVFPSPSDVKLNGVACTEHSGPVTR
ncbi:cellulose binding domain-containing protein [Saccharothrix saharensis]|nr:cellulose binding domain-containing protein [Saccharothrix saharensis]